MKKLLLLSCLVGSVLSTQAQHTLYGASPYVQNFNTIGSGLPTGWKVYSGSSATSIGTLGNYSTATSDAIYNYLHDTTCGNVTGGFKNYPSANTAAMESATCLAQQAATDRALGVRQVSPTNASNPNLDSGAAFVFTVANTGGITNLACSFKLQSLDSSSPRLTTWRLQYRIGTSGSWVQVTPTGTMTTGGLLFSNNPVSASFGTALDNQSSQVSIRLVTLDFSNSSLGSGNRASTAIDDFNLTWTGSASVASVNAANALPFEVLGSASSSNINFQMSAENAGKYSLTLTDMTGRTVHSQSFDVEAGTQNITASGMNIAPGLYVARLSNGASNGVVKVVVE